MATLDALRIALRQQIPSEASTKALSDDEYQHGFDLFLHHNGWSNYRDFVIPKLSQLLQSQFVSRKEVSVLEVGPGPKSVFGYLPNFMRKKITSYTAYEPNHLFAEKLKTWLHPTKHASPFPSLCTSSINIEAFTQETVVHKKQHIIIFCHSLYGVPSKDQVVRHALDMISEKPKNGILVVCHRDTAPFLNDLVCQRSAIFPDGTVRMEDSNNKIDKFALFVAGCSIQPDKMRNAIHNDWRNVCRNLARYDNSHPDTLTFASPEVIMTFTRHSTALPELTAVVPPASKDYKVKNREAQSHAPAAVVRPTEVGQVQRCVTWALKHLFCLTVVGGGHSGHCRWRNVVSVDMGAFDQVRIVRNAGGSNEGHPLVVAGTGCKTGDIIQAAQSEGLTVPLGSRPSVGSGLWLQGGIGHLLRPHGLACDAIVGAVLVSVESGQVLYVGEVPHEHQPIGAVRPDNEYDLLWSIKGAGNNFGIIISVTLKAYPARSFVVKDWSIGLKDEDHAKDILQNFASTLARPLDRDSSVDAYLYYANTQLMLGVTLFQSMATTTGKDPFPATPESFIQVIGESGSTKTVDAVGLFDTEMYMSLMHGGHGGGKTSSFKRCVFLKDFEQTNITNILLTAINSRPSAMCYFHLLHGGWPVQEVASDGTAFGCRDWDFACVVTGVWPREDDNSPTARAITRWVYDVVEALLPVSQGVYGADLGPDPRDAILATKAFGPNLRKLVKMKQIFDPHRVLPYACPLSKDMLSQKMVVLVTGEHGAGKDYCANVWAAAIKGHGHSTAVLGIGDVMKREYASQRGADSERLLGDRVYKEKHREALAAFFNQQLEHRPHLAEEHFTEAVRSADVDILFITGMREEAPVANLWHLVSDVRLVDVHVKASHKIRGLRRQIFTNGHSISHGNFNCTETLVSNYRPDFVFDNDIASDDQVKAFAKHSLLPFLGDDLQSLAGMVPSVPDFPRPGTEFRHVLEIGQQKGGYKLCTSLFKQHLKCDWRKIDAIVSCDVGGHIFAPSLALEVDVRSILVRIPGKLPPPIISAEKSPSHVSSHVNGVKVEGNEMGDDKLRKGARVVVIDDVLATGNTLLSMLKLLNRAGIDMEDVSVMVVAEFPIHRGRQRLRQGGFGRVGIQSLLVFDGE
ncbi:Adenine phosphoribosyltransferase [Fusarium culmorum]|uniref:Adenine phosphoribosyltransferase n=1 Tax=Fusarium culmorum TaxID=5516 RepID=A0A2T4GSD4_FUSCU|nr:Adenine phosphoribosyltransferase [Fusarium culmorum]